MSSDDESSGVPGFRPVRTASTRVGGGTNAADIAKRRGTCKPHPSRAFGAAIFDSPSHRNKFHEGSAWKVLLGSVRESAAF